ncbi:unnamed protein product, partial [Didymodactylos carnosus]
MSVIPCIISSIYPNGWSKQKIQAQSSAQLASEDAKKGETDTVYRRKDTLDKEGACCQTRPYYEPADGGGANVEDYPSCHG